MVAAFASFAAMKAVAASPISSLGRVVTRPQPQNKIIISNVLSFNTFKIILFLEKRDYYFAVIMKLARRF